MYVDDAFIIQDVQTEPHIAKLNLAMMFINELERHADWFRRGLYLIDALRKEREKKE